MRVFNSGKVLPGTSVAGLDLGGSSSDAVVDRFADAASPSVTLRSDSRDFTVKAPRAGFEVDLDATAERALDAGRGFGFELLAGPLVLVGDRDSPLVYEPVDEPKLQATVKRIAERVDRDPFVGALSINPGSLAVRTEQPRAGLTVARGPAREALADAFETAGRKSNCRCDGSQRPIHPRLPRWAAMPRPTCARHYEYAPPATPRASPRAA